MTKSRLLYVPIQVIITLLTLFFSTVSFSFGQAPGMNFSQGGSIGANALAGKSLSDLVKKDQFSVDPSVYMLGPGDEIEIRCSKMPWGRYAGTVNDAGILYVPEFGMMKVGLKTFAVGKQDIVSIVRKNCMGGDIDVSLTMPKKAEVILIGEALNSGSYRLDGALRVLDAVKQALKDSTFLTTQINLREILVTIQGQTSSFDVARFMATGSSEDNPYLYPGSIITVMPMMKRLTISGAVFGTLPSTISFKSHETIGKVLALYKFAPDADSSTIQLLRKNEEPATLNYTDISFMPIENYDNIVIGVKSPRIPLLQVTIKGEVKNPGVYPVTPQSTTARQIIELAGGVSSLGDPSRTYVRRKDPLLSAHTKIAEGLISVRAETNFSARQMLASGDYRIVPLTENVDAKLENGDEIVVPLACHNVFVSGYVEKPGAYPYQDGKGIGYYISQAGGRTGNGDKANTKLVAVYGDSWSVKDAPIAPGDVIVVPEKVQDRVMPWLDFTMRTVYYLSLGVLAIIQINDKLHFFQTPTN